MNDDKQLDLFGGETDVSKMDYSRKTSRKPTIKETFRVMAGFNREHKCKDCSHLVAFKYNRTYYKCEKMGITNSDASDIRLSDDSCNFFEERNK